MTTTLISIASAVGVGLIGVVWAMLNFRLKKTDDTKVDKAWCKPTHDALYHDIADIKINQKEMKDKQVSIEIKQELMFQSLGRVEKYLETMNGNSKSHTDGLLKTRIDD